MKTEYLYSKRLLESLSRESLVILMDEHGYETDNNYKEYDEEFMILQLGSIEFL